MRLLFVIDSFGSGGAQRQMVQLAIALHRRGHTVEFFIYAPDHTHFRPLIEAAGIRIHQSEKASRLGLSVVADLAALIRREAYDVVLAYMTTPSIYSVAATRLARPGARRPRTVLSERTSPAAVPLKLRLLMRLYALADHVVTNSHEALQQLTALLPGVGDRASVIRNGIDLDAFSPGAGSAVRSGRDLKILAMGTLLPTKDALTLIDALSHHRNRHGWTPTVSWAGKLGSTVGFGGYERAVRARIAGLGLESSWHWLGVRDDVPDLLRAHDLLVHPSVVEGLPNAVCEALAAGLPVIAADIGDNALLVEQGVTGYLYPAGEAASLSELLERFGALPRDRLAEMSSAARQFAETNLGMERCATDYEALFERLLSR
jgi:GalNAc-alpha-(1->4)-GalNAc-alpha-(1->3)-diNAcBac-PP-undecaprenol alpha-1,4-N-acetyl-D-galactosaminyltransferase